MTEAPSTRTLVLISASFYAGFCSLPFLYPALRSAIGELADVAQMTAYLWPYPLFLSLLRSLEGSTTTLIVVDVLGLGVVVLVSAYAFRRLRGSGGKARPSILSSEGVEPTPHSTLLTDGNDLVYPACE